MTGEPYFQQFTELIEAAAGVVSETELDTVLRRLVREAKAATGAKYAALGVLGEHGVLSDFLQEGLTEQEANLIGDLPHGRGVLGTVIRENKTVRLDSIRDHPDSYGFPDHHPPMESFVGVPVTAGGDAFGNLYLTEKEGGFTDSDVIVVEALSRIAGSAVQTARLQARLRRVAVVEDRERIARDLHDSVIQDLFAVGLRLQSISAQVDDMSFSETMDDAVDRLDDAVESLREYVFRLKSERETPTLLDETLQELVSRMGSAYPSKVSLHVDLHGQLDPIVGGEIEMIVTEALSNALRHASANNVSVEVTGDNAAWRVSVEDDGSGFEVLQTSPGQGLLNMKTRAARLRAAYELSSTPGTGTRVVVSQGVR